MNEAISLGFEPSTLLSIAGSGVLERLRSQYLPELQSLHQECVWLRSNLGLEKKRDLQSNEAKLLQFVGMLDIVIKKILAVTDNDLQNENNVRGLLTLEMNIVRTILPVRSRLHEKWAAFRKEDSDKKKSKDSTQSVKKNKDNPSKLSKKVEEQIVMKQKSDAVTSNKEIKIEKSQNGKSKIDKNDILSVKQGSSSLLPQGRLKFSMDKAKINPPLVAIAPLNVNLSKDRTVNKTSNIVQVAPMPISKNDTLRHQKQLKQKLGTKTTISDDISESHIQGSSDVIGVTNEAYLHENIFDDSLSENDMLSGPMDYVDDSSDSQGKRMIIESFNALSHEGSSKRRLNSEDFDFDPANSFNDSDLMMIKYEENGEQEEEYMSARRRRKLSQVVPNPRKPREANYNCSICGAAYSVVVNENPWWAVYTHECPTCKATQIPRIDIGLESNAIELDPNIGALYGDGIAGDSDEELNLDGFSEDEGANAQTSYLADQREGEPLLAEAEEGVEVEVKAPKSGSAPDAFDGDGMLPKEEASKLLVLMCHARSCSGSHMSDQHAEICRSTKFLMLHIRDCQGTDVHGRECLFPWCRPCKRMLRHLTQCFEPDKCSVCNPWCLPESFQQLRRLNQLNVCQDIQ